ncbi:MULTISPECIES: GreA/GreB family elongation factor [unclassified Corallococcus]|uniref:GreA/GreB family elongation factor n=1 Tax=Corallococcus TaxID=83461 RepID=UPI001CBB6B8D|nr:MULTISPECIES: GreA/GreB family elongation factor [unclassified Corallococcus]MBZ4332253.1 GreA/GreB family elongation factor [Corallococcus sp. AS-1-12]MBZ4372188.1 GreA/GreB family elongation factor [Corallococcus sp. AS-1-6]
MSKAFTKEDGGGDEGLTPARPRSTSAERRYITPEGYRALQEELLELQGPAPRDWPELEAGVRKRERERRARELTAILEDVRVVAPEPSQAGRVFFGAWVVLEDEDGARMRYRIVGPDEADVKAGRLSVESPLARALLGKEAGEAVQVERPRGTVEYEILAVEYAESEAAAAAP